MPTVHLIDEPGTTPATHRGGQDGPRTNPPCPERHLIRSKETHHERQDPLCRHRRTRPGQLAGAVAQESQPLTRAEVNKAWAQAQADGTLRKNDYDYDANDFKAPSTLSRAEVIAEIAGAARPGADRPAAQPHLQPRWHGEPARLDACPGSRSRPRSSPRARDGTLRRTRLRRRDRAGRPPRAGAHAGPVLARTGAVGSGS